MQTKTVLGLSANPRTMAIAIMQGTTLINYHLSLFKGEYSAEKQELILTRLQSLLAAYTINEIALVLPYDNHTTPHITSLLEAITTHFKKQNMPVCTYYPETFYLLCKAGQPQTKKTMMQAIGERYPEMQRLYLREMRNKNKYYVRLFEAVALAYIHSKAF